MLTGVKKSEKAKTLHSKPKDKKKRNNRNVHTKNTSSEGGHT